MNLPSTLLLAASAVELGRILGLSLPLRHIAAFALVSIRPVSGQLVTAENDVAVAALFLAALCYTFRYLEERRNKHLLLAGTCIGLLGGRPQNSRPAALGSLHSTAANRAMASGTRVAAERRHSCICARRTGFKLRAAHRH
jgi:hypothetical protein